jgi:hypothetical protein
MYSTLSYRHSNFAYVLLCYFRWIVSSKQVTSQAIIVTHEDSGIWLTARIYLTLFIPRGSLIPGFRSEIARMAVASSRPRASRNSRLASLGLEISSSGRRMALWFHTKMLYANRQGEAKLDQCYANDCVCNFRHQGVFDRERLCTSGVTVLQY